MSMTLMNSENNKIADPHRLNLTDKMNLRRGI